MKNVLIIMMGLYLSSCATPTEGMGNTTIEPIGELTLYYPNGTDTTTIITHKKIYGGVKTIRYIDTDGNEHITTLDFHYTQYRK